MSKLKAGLMVICNLIHRIKISHEIHIKKRFIQIYLVRGDRIRNFDILKKIDT